MEDLRDHFAGEGNVTRNLAEAKRLHQAICYKSERAMPFENFFTQCQKMCNIFEKEGKEMSGEAKVHFISKKVEHSDLHSSIVVLKVLETMGQFFMYTMAVNHLATALLELPEVLANVCKEYIRCYSDWG